MSEFTSAKDLFSNRVGGEKPFKFDSPEQEAFFRWRAGELNDDQYGDMLAMLAGQSAYKASPLLLPVLPAHAEVYVKSRFQGRAELDESVTPILCKWIVEYTSKREANLSDWKSLSRSHARCKAKNMVTESTQLEQALLRFSKIKFYPKELLDQVIAVIDKDQRERKGA